MKPSGNPTWVKTPISLAKLQAIEDALKSLENVDALPANGLAGRIVRLTTDGGLYLDTGAAWVEIWHAGTDGPGSGLDADTVDSYHAGNSSNQVPLSNGTVNTNLNADKTDGIHLRVTASLLEFSSDGNTWTQAGIPEGKVFFYSLLG